MNTLITNNLMYALPEIFLLGLISMVLLVDVYAKRWGALTYLLTQCGIVAAAVLVQATMSYNSGVVFEGHFMLNSFTVTLKLFVLATLFVVLLYSRAFLEARALARGEYYVLALSSALGMMLLISANSLLMLYLGLELMSLPLYALVAMARTETQTVEAGMKYFILGALASGCLLYGMSLLFGLSGSLYLPEVMSAVTNSTQTGLIVMALVFLMAGFMFKLGGVPFHMWVPDVYAGAPLSVTLLIASAPKIAAMVLAYRIIHDVLPVMQQMWLVCLGVIAFLSLAIGNIFALSQTNIKRLLAYSAIAHVGYMSLGLMVGQFDVVLFYLLAYILVTAAGFGVLLWLSGNGVECTEITDLKGLSQSKPWLAFLLLLVMFSMAGVPPTVGFFAKFGILKALVEQGLVSLAACAVVFSIIGAFYYLRVVKTIYFDAPEPDVAPAPAVGAAHQCLLSLNALMVLVLGLYPAGLMLLCQSILR